MNENEMVDALFKILHIFAEMEGTWFSEQWEHFGISDEMKQRIDEEYQKRFPF